MGQISLVVGGCRSGKTAFSQGLAGDCKNVVYLATARVGDEEMRQRIEEHQKQRPSHWQTVEAHQNMAAGLQELPPQTEVVVIDCLTLYLNNFILESEQPWCGELIPDTGAQQQCRREWEQELTRLLAAARKVKPRVVFVSNEVGQGIVPDTPLVRFYRDLHGAMNQAVAKAADRVYKMEVGIPMKIK